MAKFETTKARQELGFTPITAVRANIDVRTGEGEVGVAIGQGLLALGEQFQLINAKTQLSESDVAAAEATNRYFLELQGNDEPETYGTSMNSLFEEFGTLAPKDRRARAVYNRRTSNLMLSVAQKTRAAAKAKLKSKAQSADFMLLQKAKENGDFTKYKASVINNTLLEVYDAKAAETLLDNADKERDIKEKNDTLGVALTQRDDEGILDVKEANKTIDAAKTLTTSEKIDLKNKITIRFNQEQFASVSATDSQIVTSRSDIRNGATEIDSIIDAFELRQGISNKDKIRFGESIKTFFSTWNSAVKEKVITDNSIRIRALKIISDVRSGNISEDSGLFQYTNLESEEKIDSTDNKNFINSIFTAAEEARDVVKQRQAAVLSEREKQLRDSIEQQISFLAPEESKEILKDFANIAVIEFNDKFREGEFKTDEIDTEVDRLMRKYTLSVARQTRAVAAREIQLAETLKEQQDETNKVITSLNREGKTQEAQDVLDEAIRLGIFELEGNEIKRTRGKKVNLSKDLVKRMFGL